jgi:hypothetical protein
VTTAGKVSRIVDTKAAVVNADDSAFFATCTPKRGENRKLSEEVCRAPLFTTLIKVRYTHAA